MTIVRRTFLVLTAATIASPALALGGRSHGRIEALTEFSDADSVVPRVRVFLPAGYDTNEQRYKTLYLLDGQYAFEGDSDGISFEADRRLTRLVDAGTIQPTIIVAIDNLGSDRFLQYMPECIYERASPEVRSTVEREIERVGATSLSSTTFIEFLKYQLKPYIDTNYRTSSNRLDTAIFGASMAGVMSGAIFVEAQETFGLGASMSPNWAIYDERFVDHPSLPELWRDYFSLLGPPEGRRFWLDHGTQMMDAGMVPHQLAIAEAMTNLGWQRGCNIQTRVYDAGHAFAQTAVQMDEVLAWLLA
ncbi:alpha/beta hydrolase [Pontixanthobacter sp.]|uniref:alpha/beta hydrolase n=1 Tax=Pontixanthobacter sp. TaxID=2792078 RepID=UPI003C7CACDD